MRPIVHGGFPFDEARKVDGWAFISSFRLSCLTSECPEAPFWWWPARASGQQETNLLQPLPWLCKMVVRGGAVLLHHSNRLGRNWPVMSATRTLAGTAFEEISPKIGQWNRR